MSQSKDLNSVAFSSPQPKNSPSPVTIVASTTIIPTTKLTFLINPTPGIPFNIVNVTPPQDGYHELVFISLDPDALLGLAAGGNIISVTNPIILSANIAYFLFFEPISARYYLDSL